MKKPNPGREPLPYTKQMSKIVKEHGAHVTKEHMAALLGLGVATLHRMFKREPKMQRDWSLANATLVKMVHNKHVELALAGDVSSIRLFLQSKHPEYKPAAMVSVEQKIETSTEILYRPVIHRYDGSVDPETPEPDDVEAADDDLDEIWDTDADEPKTPREIQMEAAERELEAASSKTEDLAAIFL